MRTKALISAIELVWIGSPKWRLMKSTKHCLNHAEVNLAPSSTILPMCHQGIGMPSTPSHPLEHVDRRKKFTFVQPGQWIGLTIEGWKGNFWWPVWLAMLIQEAAIAVFIATVMVMTSASAVAVSIVEAKFGVVVIATAVVVEAAPHHGRSDTCRSRRSHAWCSRRSCTHRSHHSHAR